MRTGDVEFESLSKESREDPVDIERDAVTTSEEVGDSADADTDPGDTPAISAAAAEFLQHVDHIRSNAHYAGTGGAEERVLQGSLSAANLSIRFLHQLAGRGWRDAVAAPATFLVGLKRYSRARQRMTLANLRLVMSVVKRHQGRGLALDDLVQEGNIGLMKAAERYDWHKGFRFSTYATWWIRQSASRAVSDQGRTIRIPVHANEKVPLISRTADELERANGRRPSSESLATKLGISPKLVSVLLARLEEPASLDDARSNGETLADTLTDTQEPDPFVSAAQLCLERAVEAALSELESRQAEVLKLRFGIGMQDSNTLEEVGAIFGLTRERIRQIEVQALKRLSHAARVNKLRDFLDARPPLNGEASNKDDDKGRKTSRKASRANGPGKQDKGGDDSKRGKRGRLKGAA